MSPTATWFALPAVVALVLAACSGEEELSVGPDPVDAGPPPRVETGAPVDVGPPDVADDGPKEPCLRQLWQKGIPYERTEARGVEDAVHVRGPIAGVSFVKEDTDDTIGDPMACEFVLTLERFAQVLKAKGVNKIGTLGSYCYRCCCSWSETNDCRGVDDPEPNCGSNGYSNHSWGRAVDVRWVYLESGQTYDINNPAHWALGASASTCKSGLANQSGVSKFMYTLACDVAANAIFKSMLTPNYNGAHRNHWHLDTGESGAPASTTIRGLSSGETLVDWGDGKGDVCGGE